jgi:hypothetical protein
MSSLKYLGASQLADHLIPLLSSFYPPRELPSPVFRLAASQKCADVVYTHIFCKRFIRQDPDTNPSKRLAHIQTSLMSFNCTCSISERMGMVTAIFNGRDRCNDILGGGYKQQNWDTDRIRGAKLGELGKTY